RDKLVTGVQTCALPISASLGTSETMHDGSERSSSASRVNRLAACRLRGERPRRVRGELGLRVFRIEESHISHNFLLKAVCDMIEIGRASCRERAQDWVV